MGLLIPYTLCVVGKRLERKGDWELDITFDFLSSQS